MLWTAGSKCTLGSHLIEMRERKKRSDPVYFANIYVVYVFQSGMKEEVFKKQQQQILESFCISATKAVMSEERRCDW